MKSMFLALIILAAAPGLSQQYDIDRSTEGPFTFKLFGVDFNKGSSLQRESVLFNEPSCRVSLAGNAMTFSYEDRRMRISSATQLSFAEPVMALEIRHILFDVFGRHMKNLSNLEVQDFTAGDTSLSATWNLLGENDATELLTTVSYIARARLLDGTQWVHNADSLTSALGSLQLERKIGEEAAPPGTP